MPVKDPHGLLKRGPMGLQAEHPVIRRAAVFPRLLLSCMSLNGKSLGLSALAGLAHCCRCCEQASSAAEAPAVPLASNLCNAPERLVRASAGHAKVGWEAALSRSSRSRERLSKGSRPRLLRRRCQGWRTVGCAIACPAATQHAR